MVKNSGKSKVEVVFRIFPDGDVIAMFPKNVGNEWWNTCGCFKHMNYQQTGTFEGQNHRYIARKTRLAKPREYRALLRELKARLPRPCPELVIRDRMVVPKTGQGPWIG